MLNCQVHFLSNWCIVRNGTATGTSFGLAMKQKSEANMVRERRLLMAATRILISVLVPALFLATTSNAVAEDSIEFLNGSTLQGTVKQVER